MAKNDGCPISDSSVCRWINKDCSDCYVHELKHDDDAIKSLENFEVTLSLLPDNFDDLLSDECCFCKQERNARAGYGVIDLGHSEPESKRGMFFGMGKKVRQRIGSLMPVSISICSECRRSFRMVEGIKWLVTIAFIVIAIGLPLAVPSVGTALGGGGTALAIGIVVAAILIGYFLGKAISQAYIRAKSERMCFNVFEIPACRDMKNRGWFTVQEDTPVSRLIFSRKPYTKKIRDLRNPEQNPPAGYQQTSFLED